MIDNFYFDKRRNKYSAHCKSCQNALERDWYKRNKDKKAESCRSYKSLPQTKELIRKNARINSKRRKKEDVIYALKKRTSTTIRNGLVQHCLTKKDKTSTILGCSFRTFANHLNITSPHQLVGMHLDHICPISMAQTEDEAYLLNHYSNFRLIPASENLAKSNSWTPEGAMLHLILLQREWPKPKEVA
jgi:hypothetical protein